MKANDFVKEFGWNEAKEALRRVIWCETAYCSMLGHGCFKSNSDCCVDINDLKRLVESHEYIESYGGLIESKRTLEMRHGVINLDGWDKLKQAIADVESCMEGV